MRTLYIEGYSGISGDMTVSALLNLGADREGLFQMLESIPVRGWHVEIGRTEKCGILASTFDVVLDEQPHVHRHMADICEIIQNTDTRESVKALAKRMFETVAEAEAQAHGVPVEEVHFHEVGAVDSIVDIMSAAYLIDSLHVDRGAVSELYEGRGQVKCQHGILPVPVPAVVNIAKNCGLSMRLTDTEGEMITPTGAAIAAALQSYGKGMAGGKPKGRIVQTGVGAGKKDFSHANILRAMIFEEEEQEETLWMLETNLDDCSGEALGYAAEILMKAGARDVTFTPIQMKKNRPAYMLGVLCEEEKRKQLEDLIFVHTTTIGIRRYRVERRALFRKTLTAETSYGMVEIKEIERPDGVCRTPEYESIRSICDRTGESFQRVFEKVKREVSEGK